MVTELNAIHKMNVLTQHKAFYATIVTGTQSNNYMATTMTAMTFMIEWRLWEQKGGLYSKCTKLNIKGYGRATLFMTLPAFLRRLFLNFLLLVLLFKLLEMAG